MRNEGIARPAQESGRYHLHRQIASGGMAHIHIARSLGAKGFTRLVAAKRIDPRLAKDAEFVEMFLDEARVASKVRHRNVVPVIDVVTIDGEIIMVQELVQGAPLHTLFSRAQQAQSRIPISIAVSIAVQTLAGLHAAHEAVDETGTPLHIVHRDVSPQNIMIATDGTARLLDFGVAKTSASARITGTGTFKGKLVYSSPEQLDGAVTRQTDLYALGVVLWELLTGQRLHAGRSDTEIFGAIMKHEPPPLTRVLAKRRVQGMIDDDTWRELKKLEPVLQRAFAHDLSKRYLNAEVMERALAAVVPPAPLADVAAWLRSIAQDVIDHLEQLIAAEEASWRSTNRSGALSMVNTGSQARLRDELPQSSTSIDTECAIPSARARSVPPRPLARPILPRLLFVIADALAVAVLVLVLLARRSPPHPASAATLPAVPLPVLAPTPASAPSAAPAISPEPAALAATEPPRTTKAPVKPRPAVHRNAKKPLSAARLRDCAIPFYYAGSKKVLTSTPRAPSTR